METSLIDEAGVRLSLAPSASLVRPKDEHPQQESMKEPVLLRRLHTDHKHIGRVLTVLENQIRKLDDDGEGPDFDLLANLIDYISEYPDAIHHPLEDQLFDHLVNKGLTPSERKLVFANLGKHVEIIAATKKLAQDVATVLNGAVISAIRLKEHVDEYIHTQRSHMWVEEQQLFPLAEHMFSDEDWVQLEQLCEAAQDPLFDKTLARYEDLYRYIVEVG